MNWNRQKKYRNGFTLMEITMAVAGFVLISFGLIALVSVLFTSFRQQGGMLSDADSARKLSFNIINELRKSERSSTGSYNIESVSSQQIVFFANLDADTLVERVRYFLQSGKLYKGIIKPTGNPLSYLSQNETVLEVQKNVANGVLPLFSYYDGNYNGVSGNPLSLPVNPTQVKFVKISLMIFNIGGKAGTNTYTITASGALRNLKTNLGN